MTRLSAIALSFCCLLTACASTSENRRELTSSEKGRMYLELAASDLNEGNPTSALTYLRQSQEYAPKAPELHYLFALTYYHKDEIALATQSARRAIQLKPDYSPAKNTLGKLLMDQGKTAEAEKYLKEAAQDLTFKEAFLAKTNLGILYYKKMNSTEAERWLTKAIFDAGDLACMAAYYRGQIYFEKNQSEKANADFQRASRYSCSQFSDAHLAMGKNLIRLKKYDQARAKLLEVQQLFPASDAAAKANDYLKEIP